MAKPNNSTSQNVSKTKIAKGGKRDEASKNKSADNEGSIKREGVSATTKDNIERSENAPKKKGPKGNPVYEQTRQDMPLWCCGKNCGRNSR